MKLVKVHWVDSQSRWGWQSAQEATAPVCLDCVTVGFILFEDNERIIISNTHSSHETVLGALDIPKAAITKIKKL